jgi:hypothetical protein
MNWISFFVFCISLLLPAPILYSFFQRDWKASRDIKLIASFGLSPLFSSLLFYYALVFGQVFYVWIGFWLVLIPFSFWSGRLQRWHRDILASCMERIKFFFVALVFLIAYVLYAWWRPITEHDTFEYLALGKSLVDGFDPFHYRFIPETGFFYVGMHGLCYPILFAMEQGLSFAFGELPFFGVKFLSGYYLLLLLMLFYFTFKRFYPELAKYATFYVGLSLGLIFSAFQFHLETMRIFMLVLSFFIFFSFIKGNLVPLSVLSLTFGLLAYLHLTGAIVAALLGFSVVLVLIKREYSFNQIFLFLVGMVFLGGIHYFLELGENSNYFMKEILR